jgi:hypothetical protein
MFHWLLFMLSFGKMVPNQYGSLQIGLGGLVRSGGRPGTGRLITAINEMATRSDPDHLMINSQPQTILMHKY